MNVSAQPDGHPAQPAGGGHQAQPVRLRPPRHRVDRRAVMWWTTQSVIFWGIGVIILGVLAALIEPARLWLTVALAAVAVVGVAETLVVPRWRYRVHRWEITEDAVYTRAGWFKQEWRVAPMSRIQTVDTKRGPLQQRFRLSSVTVTTASAAGPVSIDGLDHELARELVEQLTETTQATPGDAT